MTQFSGALTNLSAYVSGDLKFVWINFPVSEEDFHKALETIGNPEEYFWTDYCYPMDGMKFEEYSSLDSLNEAGEFLDNLSGDEEEAFSAILENGGDFDEAIKILKSGDYQYYDDCNTEEDLGYIIAENFTIPKELVFYIDYEKMGRDYNINASGGFTNNGYIEIF